MVDKEDFDKIKDIKWVLSVTKTSTTVIGNLEGKTVNIHQYLCREVKETNDGNIQHYNGNLFDNRHQNLKRKKALTTQNCK